MKIERIFFMVRGEEIPEIDVVDKVINKINYLEFKENYSLRYKKIITGISAIAASIILFIGIQTYKEYNSPMNYLYSFQNEIEYYYYNY